MIFILSGENPRFDGGTPVRAGDKIEHIFGPVATTPDNIENIWQRQKDNLPFAWQEENLLCSVFMIDFHKQIVLRHQVIGGDQQ